MGAGGDLALGVLCNCVVGGRGEGLVAAPISGLGELSSSTVMSVNASSGIVMASERACCAKRSQAA